MELGEERVMMMLGRFRQVVLQWMVWGYVFVAIVPFLDFRQRSLYLKPHNFAITSPSLLLLPYLLLVYHLLYCTSPSRFYREWKHIRSTLSIDSITSLLVDCASHGDVKIPRKQSANLPGEQTVVAVRQEPPRASAAALPQ